MGGGYETEDHTRPVIERDTRHASDLYGEPPAKREKLGENLSKLVKSDENGIVFGPEGSGKKSAIVKNLENFEVGFIDLKIIEDISLQDAPKDTNYNFFEFTADILEKNNLDAYVIFHCSLLRKEELKTVLDYLEMFTDNENKIIQVWNYSAFLSLKHEEPMYLERYGKHLIPFKPAGTNSNRILKDSNTVKDLEKTIGSTKLSPTRRNVLEVLLSGVRGEFPSHRKNHYSSREIMNLINERQETEISKNTVATHISNLKKYNILDSGVQEGREVKYSLKDSIVKIYVESLLFGDKYGN